MDVFYSRLRINISFAGQKGLSYYYAGDPFKVNLFLWWKGGEQLRLSRVYTKSYSHALSLSLYLQHTFFIFLFLSNTHHTRFLCDTNTHTFSLSPSLFLKHTHTIFLSPSLSHTHSHSYTHTHFLPLSLCHKYTHTHVISYACTLLSSFNFGLKNLNVIHVSWSMAFHKKNLRHPK